MRTFTSNDIFMIKSMFVFLIIILIFIYFKFTLFPIIKNQAVNKFKKWKRRRERKKFLKRGNHTSEYINSIWDEVKKL